MFRAAWPDGEEDAPGPWFGIHERLDLLAVSVRQALLRVACPLAETLEALLRRRSWVRFGYSNLGDYARERLDRSGRWVRMMGVLGRGIGRHAALRAAVTGEDGGPPLGLVSARLLAGRFSTDAEIRRWIARARQLTVRELRQALRGESAPREARIRTVSVAMPHEVRVVFEDVLRLHRAVEGHEDSVTGFIEALVGESATTMPEAVLPDADPAPDARDEPLSPEPVRRPEGRMSSHLERRVTAELEALLALEADAGTEEAAALDTRARELLRLEASLRRRLGELIVALGERGGWKSLGFRGMGHYLEERLGLARSTGRQWAWIARRVRGRAILEEAYERGALSAEQLRVVLRVAGEGPDLDRIWLEHARTLTVKRLRDEERALWARGTREPMADADWHRSLELKPGATRARVQAVVDALDDPAAPSKVADVFLVLRLPEDLADMFMATIEHRREAGPAWLGLLRMLAEYVEVWDLPPPRRRRAERVYSRDGWRCMAPGCTVRRHLEEHHVVYRSRGGSRTAMSNRVCLCRFHHHMGEHGGLGRVRGRAPLRLRWALGNQRLGGLWENERRVEARGAS